jgi:uncharacterized protein YciI
VKSLIPTVLAVVCAVSTAAKAADWPPPGLTCPQRTLVVFKPGLKSDQAAALYSAHLDFIISHLRAGDILTAGPFSEAEGGVMIFRNKDWSAVEQLLVGEPFTKGGVFAIDRHVVWNACELAK